MHQKGSQNFYYPETAAQNLVKQAHASSRERGTPLSVAIVNYNTCPYLRACLASVAAESPQEVIVLDNGSSDGSAEMVQADYPQFRLIIKQDNCGYGSAANQIISQCTCAYVLLLNGDTLLRPGALRALGDYLDQNPQVAIAGPRLVYPDGSLQISCFPFPSPLYAFLQVNITGVLLGRIPILRAGYLPAWSHDRPRSVPWVLGAALAIRRQAFEAIGGFDEAYFMYAEEVDLCYRLRKAGWQIHFAPVTEAVHTGGASTMQQRAAMEVQKYISTRQFYRRHYSGRQMQQLKLIVTYTMIRNLIRDTVRRYTDRREQERARIAEDLSIWKRVLKEHWQAKEKHG